MQLPRGNQTEFRYRAVDEIAAASGALLSSQKHRQPATSR
jgi:hypothetical protein